MGRIGGLECLKPRWLQETTESRMFEEKLGLDWEEATYNAGQYDTTCGRLEGTNSSKHPDEDLAVHG